MNNYDAFIKVQNKINVILKELINIMSYRFFYILNEDAGYIN